MKLTTKQVQKLKKHIDSEIRELAARWLEAYEELKEKMERKENILSSTSKLSTIDSQLYYLAKESGEDV